MYIVGSFLTVLEELGLSRCLALGQFKSAQCSYNRQTDGPYHRQTLTQTNLSTKPTDRQTITQTNRQTIQQTNLKTDLYT